MEKEPNVSAILKKKPKGTKLWSPIFGNCEFSRLSGSGIRVFPIHNGFTSTEEKSFFMTGQYTLACEVCLFPSKQMLDWEKFAWKKGDVLVSNDGGTEIIFDKWYDDTYTSFYGKHYLNSENENNVKYLEGFVHTTERYVLESKDAAQTYINTIEERLGGKLNLETLEIEHPKQEFKDGDIVFVESSFIGIHTKSMIAIFNKDIDNCYEFYFALCNEDYDGATTLRILPIMLKETQVEYIRLATNSEKQQLYDALAKKGKRWNPVTKQIEDLPKKYEFKPFDKVLVRGNDAETWIATLFGFYDKVFGNYVCIGGVFGQCIPYNEETAHLLGTTDDWEGGE